MSDKVILKNIRKAVENDNKDESKNEYIMLVILLNTLGYQIEER